MALGKRCRRNIVAAKWELQRRPSFIFQHGAGVLFRYPSRADQNNKSMKYTGKIYFAHSFLPHSHGRSHVEGATTRPGSVLPVLVSPRTTLLPAIQCSCRSTCFWFREAADPVFLSKYLQHYSQLPEHDPPRRTCYCARHHVGAIAARRDHFVCKITNGPRSQN